jgi:predicted TIM-barrel enzyme
MKWFCEAVTVEWSEILYGLAALQSNSSVGYIVNFNMNIAFCGSLKGWLNHMGMGIGTGVELFGC